MEKGKQIKDPAFKYRDLYPLKFVKKAFHNLYVCIIEILNLK